MQTVDLERFDEEFQKLCAAYGVPATKHRKDAYWSGLRKMSIGQFERCIELALGEVGPDAFPPPKAIWKLHRLAQSAANTNRDLVAPKAPDHLEYFANRLMFLHLTHRSGLQSTGTFIPGERLISGMSNCKSSPELQRCLAFKRQLVDEFLGYIREGDELATPAEFYRQWLVGLQVVSKVEQRTVKALEASMEHPDALKPFEIAMARDLAPIQADLA